MIGLTRSTAWAPVKPVFVLGILFLAGTLFAADAQFALRGYRQFSHAVQTQGSGPTASAVHQFKFENPTRAVIFASKIFSDFQLSIGNQLEAWDGPKGSQDVLVLDDQGFIVPILARGTSLVQVLVGTDKKILLEELRAIQPDHPLRRSELSHPLFMDKWDRYCFGTWQGVADVFADPDYKTPEAFYDWMGRIGLNAQMNTVRSTDLTINDNAFTWLRHYFNRYGVKFQNVEWLENCADLYNRNPFLSSFGGSGVMPRWIYYGESPHAPGLLRDVQNASAINLLKTMDADEKLMAILDPNGEIAAQYRFYGEWSEYGPVQRRNFVRYLQEFRKFSLKDVSLRYTGQPDSFKSWDDVQMVDWRTFYGWTDASLDLAGEWRIMRDDRSEGLRQQWHSPSYDDSDWIRLFYPGDATFQTLFSPDSNAPIWMRRTITVDSFHRTGPMYLTVAPLTPQSVEVFVNGRRLAAVEPRVRTLRAVGQFDITDALQSDSKLTVVLRMISSDAPQGPVFLTGKKMEDFPTGDPCLNARRFDHFDFMDWAVADSVRSTILNIRSVDPDRPVKVHAYEHSPYGWRVIKELGGYSHHTGSGPGWQWTEPKQYALTRNLQDSSETGGPMGTFRDVRGLMGNLIYMGKNAHDYFNNIQSITRIPGARKWLEERLPAIRIMGRANVHTSPLASFRGLQNADYIGEFSKEESWRHGYDFARGGEMTPLLDELRIKEGQLPYRAIFDEGNLCWDDAVAQALEEYVTQGGILFLQSGSGRHSDSARDVWTGARLAGVSMLGDREEDEISIVSADDPLLSSVQDKSERTIRHTMAKCLAIRTLEGTSVVGTFKDASPAVTRRAIGKGSVYFCAAGVWPHFIRAAVVKRLGAEIHANASGGGIDLLRTIQSNNGCEELLMLRGLGKLGAVEWTLDFTPSRVYDPVTGNDVEAKIDGNIVRLNVNIPDWDFTWVAVRRPNPQAQFAHWLTRQTEMWKGLVKGTPPPDIAPFRHLDLNRGWLLAQTSSMDEAARLADLPDSEAGMKPTQLVLWDAPGLGVNPELAVGLYRRYFDLPTAWTDSDHYNLQIDGRIANSPLRGFSGPVRIRLNGAELWNGEKLEAQFLDLSGKVKKSGNKLEIIHQGAGIMPSICLVRSVPPASTIPLRGEWRAVDGPQSESAFNLPGKIETSFIYKDVTIPAELSAQEVWVRIDTESPRSSKFLIVNGRKRYEFLVDRDSLSPLEINITPDVRFGAVNRIVIGNQGMADGWKKSIHDYRNAEIGFYEPGRWNADGQGIRTALNERELASVLQIGREIAFYPLIQPPVSKSPVTIRKFTAAQIDSYMPPPPILNLKLDVAPDDIVDQSRNHVPVKIHGTAVAFSEHGGKIRGIFLKNAAGSPGWIELPNAPLQNLLVGKPFSICAWIKPVLEGENGAFLRWGNMLTWDIGLADSTFSINGNWNDRLNANGVVSPRQWQFLSLVMDGNKARMWIDGVEVGSRQWNTGLAPWHSPLFIGTAFGTGHFLNTKLAGLSIYPKALDDDEMAKLYLKSRPRFASPANDAGLEDDLVRLGIRKAGIADVSEIPAAIEAGVGLRVAREDSQTVLRFDGVDSYLFINEQPNVHVLGEPFSMILDIKPDESSAGCLFRRYHSLALSLEKDGSLRFDANIGRNRSITFPKVVSFAQWNRLMLTYDGKTASLFKDGKLVERRDYPGHLSQDRRLMLCIGADNTWPRKNGKIAWQIPMSMREFRIVPKILEAMPVPDGRFKP